MSLPLERCSTTSYSPSKATKASHASVGAPLAALTVPLMSRDRFAREHDTTCSSRAACASDERVLPTCSESTAAEPASTTAGATLYVAETARYANEKSDSTNVTPPSKLTATATLPPSLAAYEGTAGVSHSTDVAFCQLPCWTDEPKRQSGEGLARSSTSALRGESEPLMATRVPPSTLPTRGRMSVIDGVGHTAIDRAFDAAPLKASIS